MSVPLFLIAVFLAVAAVSTCCGWNRKDATLTASQQKVSTSAR